MTFVEGAWIGVMLMVCAGILARIAVTNREIREKREWEMLDDVRQDSDKTNDVDELLDIRKWLEDNKANLMTVELQSACTRLILRVEKKLSSL